MGIMIFRESEARIEVEKSEIKVMGVRHLPQVLSIEREAFNNPWSASAFIKEIYNNTALYYIADLSGEVVGYLGSWILSRKLHITNLAIAEDYRRQGLATEFLEFICLKAEELNRPQISLEVRASNKSAQNLYYKAGFDKIKTKPNYYKDTGEAAIVMKKQLTIDN